MRHLILVMAFSALTGCDPPRTWACQVCFTGHAPEAGLCETTVTTGTQTAAKAAARATLCARVGDTAKCRNAWELDRFDFTCVERKAAPP